MTLRSVVDVHMILRRRDGQILLAQRAGTGYADGRWNVPGGKLEAGEDVLTAAIREAREEVGVEIDPGDVRFVTVVHHRNPGGEARVGFFFTTDRWRGEPFNAEPDKCSELIWIDPDVPPPDTIAYSSTGLAQLRSGLPFTLDGWSDIPLACDGVADSASGRELERV